MSDSAMPSAGDAAYGSFESKWLARYPEQAAVAVFLSPAERLRTSAFGCLIHEIEQATFGLREMQVAAVKLAWWRQELTGAAAGNPRHPISFVLFADPHAQALDADHWLAVIDGAISVLDTPSFSTPDDLLAHYATLYTPVARLECALFGRPEDGFDDAGRMWAISHALCILATWTGADEHMPLPLDLVARHGLTRAAFVHRGAARSAAIREYLAWLGARASDALARSSAATLSREVRTRLDIRLIERAQRAPDPMLWLIEHPHASQWTCVWYAWSQARRAARSRKPLEP